MTMALPWFGPAYVTGFAAALIVLLFPRRLTQNAVTALAGYSMVVAALCAGVAVRGTLYDVSGEPFALPQVPVAVSMPTKLGPPQGRDSEISVDLLASASDARGVSSPLVLRKDDRAVISGWAYALPENSACAGVAAFVDGKPFTGTYGAQRADVAAALGGNHRFTGYNIVVPAQSLGRGSHRLSILCVSAAGRSYESMTTYTVTVRP